MNLGVLSILWFGLVSLTKQFHWLERIRGNDQGYLSRKGWQEKMDECHSNDTGLYAGDTVLIGWRISKVFETNANLYASGKSAEMNNKQGILSCMLMHFHEFSFLRIKANSFWGFTIATACAKEFTCIVWSSKYHCVVYTAYLPLTYEETESQYS